MTDFFALLDEPRRPWLEPEALKENFLSLSATVHPDRAHHLGEADRAAAQERYVALNAAYQGLREPKDRLRHLLELEQARPSELQRIPPELMNLSLTIGQNCREADQLHVEGVKISSPLLKVQWFERSQERIEALQQLQREVKTRRDGLIAELRRADADWTRPAVAAAGREELLRRLEELYRLFSYADRWLSQLQERILRLSV